MRHIFLAAGKSSRIYKKIKKNKCLIEINKKPLLLVLINELQKINITNISVVTGFKSSNLKNALKNLPNIDFIFNKKYKSTEMLSSLILALKRYDTDLLISYSDIIFNSSIITKVINLNEKNITIPILSNWKKIWKIRKKNLLEDGETLRINKGGFLNEIGNNINRLQDVKYQFMGIIYIPKKFRKKILLEYNKVSYNKKLHTTQFLNMLLKKKYKINTVKIKNGWYEFDDYEDYKNYKRYYI